MREQKYLSQNQSIRVRIRTKDIEIIIATIKY